MRYVRQVFALFGLLVNPRSITTAHPRRHEISLVPIQPLPVPDSHAVPLSNLKLSVIPSIVHLSLESIFKWVLKPLTTGTRRLIIRLVGLKVARVSNITAPPPGLF